VGARRHYSPGTFCWADLATPDVENAKAFYGGLLEWEFELMESGDAPDLVVARREGARVAALHEATNQPPHWNNYVTVEDVDVAARRAEELGGSVVAGPLDVLPAGRMAAISGSPGMIGGDDTRTRVFFLALRTASPVFRHDARSTPG
jgi:uncharacterized protein